MYYLHFDKVGETFLGHHMAQNSSYNWINLITMETHNFTASLFYFQASERGKIGPYVYTCTPCNFLNLTEIVIYCKDY